MGLLQRLNESQSKILEDKKKSFLDVFVEETDKIKVSIEYPNQIFGIYSRILNIKKGSLLLLDDSSSRYVPVSNANLDLTTTRHLRISKSLLFDNFSQFNKPISKSDNLVKSIKHYFSIREFSALESICFIPLYSSELPKAIILIINPDSDIIVKAEEISKTSNKIVKNLIKSRIPFNKTSTDHIESIENNPIPVLEHFLEASIIDNSKKLLILTIELDKMLDFLYTKLTQLDEFDIYSDLIHSISKLINNSGKLVKINRNKFLIYYRLSVNTTPELVTHQLRTAISSFFAIPDNMPDIISDQYLFNGPITESAENILEGII